MSDRKRIGSFPRRVCPAFIGIIFSVAALAESPEFISGFDPAAMDTSADPCEDFYQYACGGWHANSPRPPDAEFWSRPFTEFAGQVSDLIVALIEESSRGGADRTADEQKVGDYYAACMDTATIEARGLTPLRNELGAINEMASLDDIGGVLGHLNRLMPYGFENALVVVQFSKDPELGRRAKRLEVKAASSGLPADFYRSDDDQSERVRESYRDHVARTLMLLGDSKDDAVRYASSVLEVETALVESLARHRELLHDPRRIAEPMTPPELYALTPRLRWQDVFRAAGVPTVERINVRDIAYFKKLEALLDSYALDHWKAHLRWNLVLSRIDLMPERFRNAHYDFYGKTLRGMEERPERSQICIESIQWQLPEAVGRMFIKAAFPEELRRRSTRVFEEVRAAMRRRIEGASWLEASTKAKAVEKLMAMEAYVGYPDHWLDDPRVVIRPDDFHGNLVRATLGRRRGAFMGMDEPVDPDWWGGSPIWIYAYHDEKRNAIVYTAGMLALHRSPEPAVTYAGIGSAWGHEIGHGFDTEGRWYGPYGGLQNWWTEADAARFRERADCIAEDYSKMEYPNGLPIDGQLVVAEQLSELAGWSLGWEAYQRATEGKSLPEIGGLESDRRFFVTNAQNWCADASDEGWRLRAATSDKAWAAPMVNGTVRNLPEFAATFSCRPDDPMVKAPEEVCRVW